MKAYTAAAPFTVEATVTEQRSATASSLAEAIVAAARIAIETNAVTVVRYGTRLAVNVTGYALEDHERAELLELLAAPEAGPSA